MTRNTNSYRTKGRAVFLAAIMVISMLAMPIAFTGVAAADLDGGDGELSTGSFATENITDGAGASAEKQDVSFNVSNVSVDDDGTFTIDYTNVSEADGEVIGATGQTNDTGNLSTFDVDFDDDEVTVDIAGSDNTTNISVDLQVTHDLSDVEPVQGVEIPIMNDSGDVLTSDTFSVEARDLDERNRAYEGQYIQSTNFSEGEDVELVRDPDDDNEFIDVETAGENGLVFFETEGLTTGDDYAFVEESEGTVNASGQLTANRFSAEWDEDEVEDAGDTTVDLELDHNRNAYTVHVTADDLDGEEVFELFEESEDLDTETNLFETTEGAILHRVNDGDFEADFDGVDTGDYDFEFDQVDTIAEDSDSITVVDGDDDDLAFVDDSPEATQGDVAEIEIDNVGGEEEGTLVIGDLDDDGYEAIVDIRDADEDGFTIEFNSYLAGNDSEYIVDSEDADVEIQTPDNENQSGIDGILDTGDYDLFLGTDTDVDYDDRDAIDDFVDDVDEVGTLFIEERNVGEMELWTATTGNAEDLEDADDIEAAIDDGLLTQTDTVAFDDALVHQIELDGVGGFFAGVDEDDLDEQLIALLTGDGETVDDRDIDQVVDLQIEQTDETRQSNRRAITLDTDELEADDIEVIYEGGELFVSINELNNDLEWTDSRDNDRTVDDEDEFSVELEISDERLLEEGDDEDPYVQLSEDDDDEYLVIGEPEFTVEDRDGEFINLNDDDEIEVEAGEDQEITAETNIAPGSEVDIRTSGTDGARFVKTQRDLVVNTDGEIVGEFDFSDREVDETFEAQLRQAGIDDRLEEDGIIVESIEDAPEDDEDDVVDDEDDVVDDDDDVVDDDDDVVDDDDDVVDDDDDVEDVDDETPGFGAIVALVALIGAALLAVRRQN